MTLNFSNFVFVVLPLVPGVSTVHFYAMYDLSGYFSLFFVVTQFAFIQSSLCFVVLVCFVCYVIILILNFFVG